MAEVEIGIGKSGRQAYGFDDIAIVPSRRTRDPEDVDISWEIDAYRFALPMMASAMDASVSPATAIAIGKVGGLACLNLEGLWTRYEDPEPVYQEIAELPDDKATRRMQELYQAPIQPELITTRLAEMRDAGVTVAGSLTPQRTQEHYKTVVAAGVDIFVIRGTTVSAEHVSKDHEPLNLKQFIYELDVPVIVGGAAATTAVVVTDRRDLEKQIRRSLAAEKLPKLIEIEMVRRDGSLVPLEGWARFIRDQEGQPIEHQGIYRDISERQRAAEARQAGDRRLRGVDDQRRTFGE